MIYYNSVESFGYDETKEKNDIVSLSYEKYFLNSINNKKEIRLFNTGIENSYEEYKQTAIILKTKFQSMSKEDENTTEVKTKFSVNIKNWFIKVWGFICSIFQKIAELVVNLIKTLILYVRKHLLIKNSLYTALKDKSISFTDVSSNEKLIKALQNLAKGKVMVKTMAINKKAADFVTISKCLNNSQLKSFISQKIIVDNKKSTFNTDYLSALLTHEEIYQKGNANDTLTEIESNFHQLNIQHMICGESIDGIGEDTNHGDMFENVSDVMANYNENVKALGNYLVYTDPEAAYTDISFFDFIGTKDLNVILNRVRTLLSIYENDAKLIIEKGGYIDILTEILKKYKVAAVNDAKNIKGMKDFITNQMNKLTGDGDDKIQHRFQRFTKLIMLVQKMKTSFIVLRQYVIGDILSAFTFEDKALSVLLYPRDYSKNEIEKIISGSGSQPDALIGGKSGSDPANLENTSSILNAKFSEDSDENLKR